MTPLLHHKVLSRVKMKSVKALLPFCTVSLCYKAKVLLKKKNKTF